MYIIVATIHRDDDAGVVTTVARVGATSFVYDDFLSSTFRVSGAILLSTGECVIEDLCINMNISIQSNSSISEGKCAPTFNMYVHVLLHK